MSAQTKQGGGPLGTPSRIKRAARAAGWVALAVAWTGFSAWCFAHLGLTFKG